MKKSLLKLLAVSGILFSSYSNAAFISNTDISNLAISAPTNWTWINSAALFDGITANGGARNQRFVGYRNTGIALNVANPFVIDVAFNSLKNIDAFSLFHDWGTQLSQQLVLLNIQSYSAGSLVGSLTFNNLALNTFGEVQLASGLTLNGVDRVVFNIAGLQKTNFEIREFVISTQDTQLSGISAPAAGLFALSLAGFAALRRKLK